MIIYYNPAYSTAPYRKNESNVEIGNIYCGDIQLLQRLLFYAGVPYLPVSSEKRIACYYAKMLKKIDESSKFYNSFKTDSAGMSYAVLGWRDALVEIGYEIKKYAGDSIKLSLLRDIEPDVMPKGVADYWFELIQIASKSKILPENVSVVVTCSEQEIKPHIANILANQKEHGVCVEYAENKSVCAEGNLGKICKAILDDSKEKIVLDGNDNTTFSYIKFINEDDALRYVATKPIDKSTVYFCSKPKRFDSTLQLLGKPTIGSSLDSSLPQVVQLFMLGNGLFEYPLNMRRIIEWLNLPINPIKNGLRRVLCKALTESGGVNNEEWNTAKNDYLVSIEDEKERKKVEKQVDMFLPMPECDKVDVESVKNFNDNLRKWAVKLLAMENFPYDEIVREQIASIESYCSALIEMLGNVSEEFNFLNLQLWCKNIAHPSVYGQYEAKVGSHTTIASMGDIHDIADRVVWFPAEDSGIEAYPFEMLNDAECEELKNSGAKLYSREEHLRINQAKMLRILLKTKSLTIIEAEKSNGEKVARHPLVLQLNERIKGGLESIVRYKALLEYMDIDYQVINQSKNPILVELGKNEMLKERHEREKDEKRQAESYSSLSNLIQHPFAYVCEKCAKLKDQEMPSAQDLEKTLGNVAHLIIEKVFNGKSIEDACVYYKANYEIIFDESVNEKGLLLRLPEYAIDLRRLKNKMEEVLDKLAKIIKNNDLTIDACEYEFKQAKWTEAGDGVMLGSRADMLLSDSKDGKVIFDFKYSRSKSRRTEIAENRALQLEVYRYMAKQEFGEDVNVRVAYVLLPDVTILTADKFKDVDSIQLMEDRASANVMSEAANSYRFRWEQFKAGKIERVEGCGVGTGEYAEQEVKHMLFPLSEYEKKYSEDKFNKGYKNLK